MPEEPLHPDEALAIVLAAAPPPVLETVALGEALGRFLVRAVVSPIDHPPFDKSAMDGFAWNGASNPGAAYRVVSLVAAGSAPAGPIAEGECARIMTGAPLPAGAGAVQRIEWTEESGTGSDGLPLIRFTRPESVSNVIRRGENLRSGELLLGPRLLEPQDMGILASGGIASVEVARRPVVGVVSTGDELCVPGSALGPASIYDSNGPALAAQAMAAGAEVRVLGPVRDDPAALRDAFARGLEECEVLLVSGGVSMGDFDHVPRTLESLGVERIFHKLKMRPGKPVYFGRRGGKAVFGLPGNPVSTFVNFEFFVRPYLAKLMGLAWNPRLVRARLSEALVRKGSDRVEFLPARLGRVTAPAGVVAGRLIPGGAMLGEVAPLSYHGSSMLNVLAGADCLLRMEIGVERIEEGVMVDARLVRT